MLDLVKARCPHCRQVLRIPSDWLARPMRCKQCKATFRAKAAGATQAAAKASTPYEAETAALVAAPAKMATAALAAGPPPASNSNDPFSFDHDEPAETSSSPGPRRKQGRGLLMLVIMFFFLFLVGASGASFVIYKAIITGPAGDPKQVVNVDPNASNNGNVPDRDPPKGVGNNDQAPPVNDGGVKKPFKKPLLPGNKDGANKKPPAFTNDPFPRRALLISVNHYLMFNDVLYGSPQGAFSPTYPGSNTAALRDRFTRPPMNFPATQVFELSDGIPSESKVVKAHSTQKSVLETTITDFVETSRDQDRIVLVFSGHGAYLEEEKQTYLVPIDGNLKKPETLLPLKWVYEKLAKCKAQQKVLILDVFRFSPSRGFELPSPGEGDEGTMPEGFDKALQNPPAGVQVWCSCLKDQSAVELEGGSAFMQALCHSLQGTTELTGISAPTQPIPVETLVDKVNQRLKELLMPEKRTQLSRLTGKPPAMEIAFNKDEPMAPKLELKPPLVAGGDVAGYAIVNNILKEIGDVPPVRDTRAGDVNLLKAQNLPAFPAKKLESYKAEGYQNLAELHARYKKDKEGYAKMFPLRAAYFEALEALQESAKIRMREVLPGPIDPKRKAAFLLEQAEPGISIFKLQQVLAQLDEVNEKRDEETSKRWHANFDYMRARLQSRLVYLFEYSYTLGQIRADNLPDLAPGQTGWRLGTGKKIAVTESKAKGYVKDTRKLWLRIQDQYPDTPWALLAQRESMISLGLLWRPKSD